MDTSLTRRALIGRTAAALAAAQLVACGLRVDTALTEADVAAALSRLARDLFPHDRVTDRHYAAIARGFLDRDIAVARLLVQRLSAPDRPYHHQDRAARLAGIEANITDAGVQAFRFAVLLGLYTDLSVTRTFGYQGPSFEDFGYLERGFDDLDWLPDPA